MDPAHLHVGLEESEIMPWIFVLAHALALLRLIWQRSPYRWFLLALALWTLQAVNVTLHANAGIEWVRTWWAYPEALALLATAAACLESNRRNRSYVSNPWRRMLIKIASTGIPFGLVGAGIYFVAPVEGPTMAGFNTIRSWIWVYLAIPVLVTELLLLLERVERPWQVVTHSWLLLVVLLAHSGLSWLVHAVDPVWFEARTASRVVVTVACLMWAITAKREVSV